MNDSRQVPDLETAPDGPGTPAAVPGPVTPAAVPGPESAPASEPERPPRAFVERLGLAAVAVFVGGLFILMATAAWVGKEGFLALMAGLGGLMTLWAGFNSFRRG